eukprot:Cvel_27688.t1-p1 / transcript=Cvel_27688.t1 / gene=Cvel_27688 / organism=Chromera_velia_CCMP2878 / gene_product=hypothetical protein / transcript_product=hypothetical protein / location=Cvel_scaffold3494:10692-15890(+) / protein_length=404 / sequence_SO=supercontig / SO=protein_coding / is_pseudo=false
MRGIKNSTNAAMIHVPLQRARHLNNLTSSARRGGAVTLNQKKRCLPLCPLSLRDMIVKLPGDGVSRQKFIDEADRIGAVGGTGALAFRLWLRTFLGRRQRTEVQLARLLVEKEDVVAAVRQELAHADVEFFRGLFVQNVKRLCKAKEWEVPSVLASVPVFDFRVPNVALAPLLRVVRSSVSSLFRLTTRRGREDKEDEEERELQPGRPAGSPSPAATYPSFPVDTWVARMGARSRLQAAPSKEKVTYHWVLWGRCLMSNTMVAVSTSNEQETKHVKAFSRIFQSFIGEVLLVFSPETATKLGDDYDHATLFVNMKRSGELLCRKTGTRSSLCSLATPPTGPPSCRCWMPEQRARRGTGQKANLAVALRGGDLGEFGAQQQQHHDGPHNAEEERPEEEAGGETGQ